MRTWLQTTREHYNFNDDDDDDDYDYYLILFLLFTYLINLLISTLMPFTRITKDRLKDTMTRRSEY